MFKFFKIILLIAFCVLCYVIFLVYPIYRSINLSEKLLTETIPYEQHPQNPSQYFLVAGDSTAVGVGAINPTESTAGRLGKQFPKADITNLGISGAKLKDLIAVLETHKEKHYDLLIIQIGANDVTHFTPYSTIQKELSEIIQLSNDLSSKTILLTAGNIGLARVFRWPLSAIITDRTKNVRAIFLKESAKETKISYIDLFKDKKDDPFEQDLKRYYAPDSFHLTGDGYGIWYSKIQEKL